MAVKILHKRSGVEFKSATGAQLEVGELALNYNESGPYLQCKDAAGEIVQLGGVYVGDSAPGNELKGAWWLRDSDKTLFLFDGNSWISIAGGGGSGGGAVTVIGGDGIESSTIGGVVTITADLNKSRGLDIVGDQIAVKLGAGLEFDASGNIKVVDGIGGTANDAVLTIEDSDGKELGTFSANQAVDDTIVVPAGFSGDYDDLTNTPAEVVVEGEDGVTVTKAGSTYTAKAAADTNRGIEIISDKIAAKLGSGLSFDVNGQIQSDSSGLSYKGSCDVTSTSIISGAADGDMYANTGDGNFSSQWAAITSNADVTTVASGGDLMIYNGTEFDHIPSSSSGGGAGTDLSVANRGNTTLDVASSTGQDATIPAATTSLAGVMTAADKTAVDSAIQPGDNVSELNNDEGFITDAGVTKLVAGNNVTLDPASGIGEVTINAAGGSGGGGGATNLGIADRDATDLDVTSDTGADATIPAATELLAGLMTAADKAKLVGIEDGANVGISDVDLSYTPDTNKGTVVNSAGDDATIPLADDTNAGLFTAAEKAKLDGIEDGATNESTNDDLYLSKVRGDTAAGAITFENKTTHELGIDVTGGQVALPGGGGATEALQKQEIDALIPAVNDATLTIKNPDGSTAGTFSANASTPVEIKIPDDTFSGSYNDLTDKPPIGNAKIVIRQDGSEKGSFTTNQDGGQVNIDLDGGSSGSGFDQSDADALYVSLTKTERISGEKTFDNILKVDNKLRAGDTDNSQFIEMYIDDKGGQGKFKVLQANGDGPMDLRDSTEWASVKLRNLGASGGHISLQPRANGKTCNGVAINSTVTKNGPRDSEDVNVYNMCQVAVQFDNSRGSKRLDEICHIRLNANNGVPDRKGFSTDTLYGIYIPDWNGRQGDFSNCRGIASNQSKGGCWFLKHDGTAPWGSTNTESNLSIGSAYGNTPGGSHRKLIVSDGGWVGSASLREADLTKNLAVEETIIRAMDGNAVLEPRLVEMPGDIQEYVDGQSTGLEAYAPSSEQFRLLPEQVAAIHPRLATYMWERKELEIRPANPETGEERVVQQVFDYEQAPTADGVDYDGVVTVLVGTIQRLRAELDDARLRLSAMEANEVIDDATDSSLLTLLADLSTRVSQLESA